MPTLQLGKSVRGTLRILYHMRKRSVLQAEVSAYYGVVALLGLQSILIISFQEVYTLCTRYQIVSNPLDLFKVDFKFLE